MKDQPFCRDGPPNIGDELQVGQNSSTVHKTHLVPLSLVYSRQEKVQMERQAVLHIG